MLCPITRTHIPVTEQNARRIAATVPLKDIPLCWRVIIHRYERARARSPLDDDHHHEK